ncbi:MAG: tRNA adenosine(34) deaminase TadA [Pseudomonadota bacterium]
MGISTDWSEIDERMMAAALEQAGRAADLGEVPVGAVVVTGDEIFATGHNVSISNNDPSGHAEIVALRSAADALGNHRLNEATLYVTLEPCVMCAGAIAQARIARVVFAAYDEKAGALGSVEDLSDSRALNHRFEVNGGLNADASRELLRRFFVSRR